MVLNKLRTVLRFFGLLSAGLLFMFWFSGWYTDYQVNKIYKNRNISRTIYHGDLIRKVPFGEKNVTEWDI